MKAIVMLIVGAGVLSFFLARSEAAEVKRRGIEIEAGAVFSGYNTIRIPRDTGSNLSLSSELTTKPASFFRVRGSYYLKRHMVSLLFAPLTVSATGRVHRDISYAGTVFPADSLLEAEYRFDSYRLTYRYSFVDRPGWDCGIGVTAKIRNAAIKIEKVEGERLMAEKTNTGFVPLVNFHFEKKFNGGSIYLDGDALAAPQGRAEDIFVGGQLDLGPDVGLFAGYRMLEGGSDVPEVYSFALFHYAALGLKARF
jgi:hypothetical protein